MITANVLWPFHGALFAQLIPFLLVIEMGMLFLYFRSVKRRSCVLAVLVANIFSTLAGLFIVFPLQIGWDSLSIKASEQFYSCIVAFLITVPLEYYVIGKFKSFKPKKQRIRAVFMANFTTYSICFFYVVYQWKWGIYAQYV